MHASGPATVLYFPAPQAVHGPPFGPEYPVLQTQPKINVCPVNHVLEFAKQVVHGPEPTLALYVPTPHSEHGPPFGPEHPNLQRHEPIAGCPEDECPEFAGQARQVLAAVAPTVAEYVFAAQSVHTEAPTLAAYFPAAQSVHTVPESARIDKEAFPAAQSVHTEAPVFTTYFPATHSRHTEAPVFPKYVPAAQAVHTVPESARIDKEAFPAAQSVHTEAPVLTTYFPATHNVHTGEPTLAAKFPAPHNVHEAAPELL